MNYACGNIVICLKKHTNALLFVVGNINTIRIIEEDNSSTSHKGIIVRHRRGYYIKAIRDKRDTWRNIKYYD